MESVHDQEGRLEAPRLGLRLRLGNGLFEEIDSRDLVAPLSQEKGVLTGTASGIEDGADDFVGDPD